MKEKSFEIEKDGFYGYLYSGEKKNLVVILYVDDDPKSMIGKGAVKWFVSRKINLLAMSPAPKNTGLKNIPIDHIEEAEKRHPLQEEEFIKVENIQGHLLLIGARDDAMWPTVKYIRRMLARLEEHPHSCSVESMIFDHGTHYVLPEGIVKKILPIGVDFLLPKMFREAKGYTRECRESRIAIEKKVLELCK